MVLRSACTQRGSFMHRTRSLQEPDYALYMHTNAGPSPVADPRQIRVGTIAQY